MTSTLRISTSKLTDSNPVLAQLATRVGAVVSAPEFFEAFVECLHQLERADDVADNAIVQISPATTHQRAHKKRKREESDEDDDSSAAVALPRASESEKSDNSSAVCLQLPAWLKPLPRNSPGFTILPQHIVFEIFEYLEILFDPQHIASLLCRFRSQTTERQYHLLYRSLHIDVEALEIAMTQHPFLIRLIMRQIRTLTLQIDEEYPHAVFLENTAEWFIPELWPQLKSVTIDFYGEYLVEPLQCSTQFLLDKIHVLHYINASEVPEENMQILSGLLPNLRKLLLSSFVNEGVERHLTGFQRLSEIQFQDNNGQIATQVGLLQSCPALKYLAIDMSQRIGTLDVQFLVEPLQQKSNLVQLVVSGGYFMCLPRVASLTRLYLECQISFDFSGITYLVNLERFSLNCSGDCIFKSAEHLASHRLLSSFELRNVPFAADREDHTELIRAIQSLTSRGQLYSLLIESWVGIPDFVLDLRAFGIEGCQLRKLGVRSYALSEFDSLSKCKHLQQVYIENFSLHLVWNPTSGSKDWQHCLQEPRRESS